MAGRWLLFGIHPPFGAEDGTAVIITYETRLGALVPKDDPLPISEEAVWIDLINPTPEEEKIIEDALGLDVPTREEQQEIEVSSRLYQEGGAHFMTATVLVQTETPEPTKTPITFILAGKRLVTVRYAEPRAFSIFLTRSSRPDTSLRNGSAILIGLIEAIVDRLADFIERVQVEVESPITFNLRDARRCQLTATALRRTS